MSLGTSKGKQALLALHPLRMVQSMQFLRDDWQFHIVAIAISLIVFGAHINIHTEMKILKLVICDLGYPNCVIIEPGIVENFEHIVRSHLHT